MNYQYWDGYRDPRFGYGSMLHGFLDAVPAGVKIDERATVDVHMGIPSSKKGWLKGTHRVCFTMWETDLLPDGFSRWLGQYDQILVPCEHNVELFGAFHGDVSAVPLGVDTGFWSPGADPMGPFKFIAGGSLWERKGLDLVVEAFNRLALPGAVLEIKAAPHAQDVPKKVPGDNVKLLRNWMSKEEQREWVRSAHVWVAPARGEGFGLMPLQAIASGVPTILTASSGQAQFSHLGTGVVPHRKMPCVLGGNWDEGDVGVLMELMRDHFDRWSFYREMALHNSQMVEQFSWGEATRKLIAAVPTGRINKNTTFIRPNVQVTATFKRAVKADIANHRYVFKAGETATIPEGVHQVLYDAGAIA